MFWLPGFTNDQNVLQESTQVIQVLLQISGIGTVVDKHSGWNDDGSDDNNRNNNEYIYMKKCYHKPRRVEYKNLHPLHYTLLPFRPSV